MDRKDQWGRTCAMDSTRIITTPELAKLVPKSAAAILIVGESPHGLDITLASRPAKTVAVEESLLMSLPQRAFDYVMLPPSDEDAIHDLLVSALTLTDEFGAFGMMTEPIPERAEPPLDFLKKAEALGLMALRSHMSHENGMMQWAFTLVRADYDPVAHAASLEHAGCPMRAYTVLDSVPEFANLTDEQLSILAIEKHRLLHDAILERQPDAMAASFFARARKEFQIAIHTHPRLHPAYRRQAALWHHFGRDDLAGRLLRSVCHVSDDPESRALLHSLGGLSHAGPEPEMAPVWSGARRAPRILVITHDNSDYGMDSLYDGLCTILGWENVVEFPWKAAVHGQTPEAALNYPCVFDYPGEPRSSAEIETELRHGHFDLILFADVVQHAYRDTVSRFLDAAGDMPVIVYDPWDDSHSLMPGVFEYLGRTSVTAHFKREMLAGFDYGPNSFPLPFGYPDRFVPDNMPTDRSPDLFWAGKRLFGTRSLYLDHLSERLGRDFDHRYSQDEYRAAIRSARIGLSIFGYGFDTVRYWELPAHGVMLLAERPPIRIPHDFIDGESAVFFDDLPELDEKLDYYLSHPEEADRIAQAGREHFLQFHTTSARARQFLGYLEDLASW